VLANRHGSGPPGTEVQLHVSTVETEAIDCLAAWTNPAGPTDAPVIVEGDALEMLALLPAHCIDLIATSPPYPRAQRKPEDLGRYRRFVDEDGSVLRGAAGSLEREQYAADHPNGLLSQRDRARMANLNASAGAPHVRKKLRREFPGQYTGAARPKNRTQWLHGKPNLNAETGLQTQIHPDHWWSWFRPIAEQLHRVLKPRRALLLNVGGVVCPTWNHHTYDWDLPSQMRSIGWQFIRPIYWLKPNGPPTTADGTMANVVEHVFWFSHGVAGDRGPIWFPWELHHTKSGTKTKRPMVRNVWEIPVGATRWPEGQAHFACFPLELAERMVRGWSTATPAAGSLFPGPPEIVLDPFLGSGTTAIAAWRLARRWIGIELNPEGEIECARARFQVEFAGSA